MTNPDKTALLVEFGTVEYGAALEFQRELVRRRQANEIPDTLVLLEHPPVITLGKHADRENLLVSEEELRRRGVSLHQVERGGDITFHGPGQLVGYTVFKIGNREWRMGNGVQANAERRTQNAELRTEESEPLNPRTLEPSNPSSLVGVRRFVETVEQALILTLADLGVSAAIRPGFIGVWVCDSTPGTLEPSTPGTLLRKVASLGIAVKRGVTMHGFALNVTTDLSWFRLMNPCGLDEVQMTSVERELGGKRGRFPLSPAPATAQTTTRRENGKRPRFSRFSQIGVQTAQDSELMKRARAAVVRGFEQAFGVRLTSEQNRLVPQAVHSVLGDRH